MRLATLLALSALALSAMCAETPVNSTVIDVGNETISALNATTVNSVATAPATEKTAPNSVPAVVVNTTDEADKSVKKNSNSLVDEAKIAPSDKLPENQPQTTAPASVTETPVQPLATQPIVTQQEQPKVPVPQPDQQQQPKRGWFDWLHIPEITHKLLLISAIASMFVLVFMVGISAYYRFYLLSKKKAPFAAPAFLSFLFPRPTNYETEISALCSKYMNEP